MKIKTKISIINMLTVVCVVLAFFSLSDISKTLSSAFFSLVTCGIFITSAYKLYNIENKLRRQYMRKKTIKLSNYNNRSISKRKTAVA